MTTPPAWLSETMMVAPAGAHYKIVLRSGWEEHDGYCSDVWGGELEVIAWDTRTVYLPVGKWTDADFADVEQWEEKDSAENYHRCGASRVAEIVSWVRVG